MKTLKVVLICLALMLSALAVEGPSAPVDKAKAINAKPGALIVEKTDAEALSFLSDLLKLRRDTTCDQHCRWPNSENCECCRYKQSCPSAASVKSTQVPTR